MANKKRFEAKITADIKDYEKNMDKAVKVSLNTGKEIVNINKNTEKEVDKSNEGIEKSNKDVEKSNDKLADNFGVNQDKIKKEQEQIEKGQESASDKIKDENEEIKDSNDKTAKSFDDLQKKHENSMNKMKSISKGFTEIGGFMTKAFTVPMIGASGALLKLGNDFKDAYNTIRIGTGATGDAFLGLKNNFMAVYKEVPQGMSEVATAIADLNTRTGLAGKELEDLALQFLNLSSITGEDLPTMIASLTRVFGDWGVETKDYGRTIDYIFKVSQSTGISVGKLAEQVTKMGTKFRNAGWDMETAMAMLGRFEKEGVSTEKAMSGVNIALNTLSREGVKDLKKGFSDLLKDIENAKDETEAYNKTIEYFGAQAGPDMFDTIRAGKLDVDELVKSLNDSGETVNGVKKETMTFGEKFKMIMHELVLALEPLGQSLVKVFEEAMPYVKDFIQKITDAINWFVDLDEDTQKLILALAGALGLMGPILTLIGKMIGGMILLAGLGMLFGGGLALGAGIALLGILVVIGAVMFLASILITGPKEWWGYFLEGGKQCFDFLTLMIFTFVSVIVDMAVSVVVVLGNMLVKAVVLVFDVLMNSAKFLLGVLAGVGAVIVNGVAFVFNAIWETIKGVFGFIVNGFKGVVSFFKGDLDGAKKHFEDAFNSIFTIADKVWDKTKKLFKDSIEGVKKFFDFEWNLPKIKTPSFSWVGSFSLNPLSVPKMDIQWKSKGAIFKRPTVLGGVGVGDKHNGMGSNAEAVLPIDKLPELLGLDKERDGGVQLHIENFINNRKQDVEQLIKEIEFEKRRKRGAY